MPEPHFTMQLNETCQINFRDRNVKWPSSDSMVIFRQGELSSSKQTHVWQM